MAEKKQVDTGEFINPDIGFQKAMEYGKRQEARIEELEQSVLQLARKLHVISHSALVSMRECRYSSCQWARAVLYPASGTPQH